jgi:hypothetical protein
VPKKVLGGNHASLRVQLIVEPGFAFCVIVRLRLIVHVCSDVPFGIPQKGGKVDGAILYDYALKNGA